MIAKRIAMTNFQSFENEELDLSKLTITSIIGSYSGNERRSNGAGKSTIFDAMIYALYGKSRTQSEDDLVQLGKNSMKVEFEFEFGNDNIKIIRGKEKKNGYLSLFINDTDQSEGKRETQEKINKKIGMGFELFIATVFFQQFNADAFTSATASVRKDYLKELLNLGLYDRCYDSISKEMKNVELEITKKRSQRDYLKQEIEENYNENNIKTELKKVKTRVQELEGEIKEDELKQKENQITLNKIKMMTESIKKLEKDINEIQEEIEETEHDINSIILKQTVEDGFEEITYDNLKEKGEKKKEDIAKSRIIIEKEKTKIEFCDSRIKSIMENDFCPICNNPFTDDGHKEKMIDGIEKEKKQHNKVIDDLEEEIEIQNRQLDDLREQFRKMKITFESNQKIINENEKKTAIKNEKEKTLSNFYNKSDAKEAELKKIKKEFAGINKKIDDFSDRIENKKCDLERQIKKQNTFENSLKDMQKKQKELNFMLSEIEKIETEYNNYNVLKGVFGKNGITSEIIKNSIDEIEENANYILQEITGDDFRVSFETLKENKDKNIRDTLEIKIETKAGLRVYESYSGGERAIINFSIRMGLSQVLTRITSGGLNLIVLDEIFGAIDEYNSDKLIKVINFLKKSFRQVFIISHTAIKDSFKNLIKISKNAKTGKSEIAEIF